MAERDQQVAQAGGEGPEGVVAATGRRRAVPGKIGCDDGVVSRERLDHRLPVLIRARHPVDQEQQGAAARLGVGHRAAVERHRLGLHRVHADAPSASRASFNGHTHAGIARPRRSDTAPETHLRNSLAGRCISARVHLSGDRLVRRAGPRRQCLAYAWRWYGYCGCSNGDRRRKACSASAPRTLRFCISRMR